MTLEMEPLEVGVNHLAASGWTAGSAYDKDADAELMAEDRIEAIKRAERNSKSGFFTCESTLLLHGRGGGGEGVTRIDGESWHHLRPFLAERPRREDRRGGGFLTRGVCLRMIKPNNVVTLAL